VHRHSALLTPSIAVVVSSLGSQSWVVAAARAAIEIESRYTLQANVVRQLRRFSAFPESEPLEIIGTSF